MVAEVSKKLSDLSPEQVSVLLDYLQTNFIPIKGINERNSAYGLKQRFSRDHFYVSQEQFTQAMERAGFIAKPIGNGNACFNISKDSPYFKKKG